MKRLPYVVALALSVFVILQSVPQTAKAQEDPRFFAATGFRISDDRFWDYFERRGGVGTFGYPVSRKFVFLGTEVQMFQRRIMQIRPDGGVGLLNILDTDIFPYTSVNGATLPPKDGSLVAQTPAVGSPGYADAVINYVAANAPDTWNGISVNFHGTFLDTVTLQDAFP